VVHRVAQGRHPAGGMSEQVEALESEMVRDGAEVRGDRLHVVAQRLAGNTRPTVCAHVRGDYAVARPRQPVHDSRQNPVETVFRDAVGGQDGGPLADLFVVELRTLALQVRHGPSFSARVRSRVGARCLGSREIQSRTPWIRDPAVSVLSDRASLTAP